MNELELELELEDSADDDDCDDDDGGGLAIKLAMKKADALSDRIIICWVLGVLFLNIFFVGVVGVVYICVELKTVKLCRSVVSQHKIR